MLEVPGKQASHFGASISPRAAEHTSVLWHSRTRHGWPSLYLYSWSQLIILTALDLIHDFLTLTFLQPFLTVANKQSCAYFWIPLHLVYDSASDGKTISWNHLHKYQWTKICLLCCDEYSSNLSRFRICRWALWCQNICLVCINFEDALAFK